MTTDGIQSSAPTMYMDKDNYLEHVLDGGDVDTLTVARDVVPTPADANDFATLLIKTRRENLLRKLVRTTEEYKTSLRKVHILLHDQSAPRYVSPRCFELLWELRHYKYIYDNNMSVCRMGKILPPEVYIAHMSVESFAIGLKTNVGPEHTNGVINLFYLSFLPGLIKYGAHYKRWPLRVAFFKVWEACGYSNTQSLNVINYFHKYNLKQTVGKDFNFDTFTNIPQTEYFKQLCFLFWLCANIYTFMCMRNHAIHICQGEAVSNEHNVLYIFNGYVGYKYTFDDVTLSELVPWKDALLLLTHFNFIIDNGNRIHQLVAENE